MRQNKTKSEAKIRHQPVHMAPLTTDPEKLSDIPPELRGYVVENMKERIYSTITLLAVIATLWHAASEHTVVGTVGTIFGAVAALWLASLISTRLSHRVVHGRSINYREYKRAVFASSGLLVPAIAPIIVVLISATGLITLKTALAISLGLLLFSMLLFSLLAGRRIYSSPWRIMLVSGLEMCVGVGVIVLKILLGE